MKAERERKIEIKRFHFPFEIQKPPFLNQQSTSTSSPLEPLIPELYSIPMEKTPPLTTVKIIRTSIHTFLTHFHYFTSTAFLALPFSASILLLPHAGIFPSLPEFLFNFAGILPFRSELLFIFTLKLSQTITSSILLLPFTLSFLMITKASLIQFLTAKRRRPFTGIFNSILRTHLLNTFIIISVNATFFWVFLILLNCLKPLKIIWVSNLLIVFSGIGYSVAIANAIIICNLALIVSGMESNGGFISILKACVMIKGKTATALSLAVPVNMAFAGIEWLFQFRIIRAYYQNSGMGISIVTIVIEGLFIAYLYSIIITIDTITGCVFFKSCKLAYENVIDEEEGRMRYGYCLEIEKEEDGNSASSFAYVKCLA